jgi:thioredoxin-dependent peroxiredoxin
MLKIGSKAPDFRLQNENEKWVTLSDILAQGPVMLVFYPGDFTPVCTKQLCSYQTAHGEFGKYGVNIVGISHNTPAEHQRFRQKYGFLFQLLSDPERKTFEEYEVVSKLLFGMRSRGNYLIAKDGTILYSHVETTSITHRKSDELIEAFEALKARGQL